MATTPRPTVLRRAARAVLLVVVAASLLVTGAPPAAAEQGLGVGTSTRAVFDPDAGVVTMTQVVTLTNRSPDRGNTYYFWDGWSFLVPTGAEDVAVTSSGRPLSHTVAATKWPGYSSVNVRFSRLMYRQSRTMELSYRLAQARFRSEDLARVGPGFASFPVLADADPGQQKLEVVAPFNVGITTSLPMTEATENGSTTWTSTADGEEGFLEAQIALDRADAGERREIVVGGRPLTIVAFPGDTAWLDFATENLPKMADAVAGVVGRPMPSGLALVREDVTVEAMGYAGSYVGSDDEIRLGEKLDTDTLAHELTHLWLDDANIDTRWLGEGLAEDVAVRAVKAAGLTPADTGAVRRDDPDAIALAEWKDTELASAVEDYAYPASRQAIGEMTAGLDDDAYGRLLAALVARAPAYGDGSDAVPAVDWHLVLDQVENRLPPEAVAADGTSAATQAVTRWVLPATTQVDWAKRGTARARYRALDGADGDWQPPQVLRDDMEHWQYDAVLRYADAYESATRAAATLQADAAASDRAIPARVRDAYEQAIGYDAVAQLPESLGSAGRALTALDRADRAAPAWLPTAPVASELVGARAQRDAASRALDEGRFADAAVAAEALQSSAGLVLPLALALVLVPLLALGGAGWAVARARAARPAQAPTPAPPSPPEPPVRIS